MSNFAGHQRLPNENRIEIKLLHNIIEWQTNVKKQEWNMLFILIA